MPLETRQIAPKFARYASFHADVRPFSGPEPVFCRVACRRQYRLHQLIDLLRPSSATGAGGDRLLSATRTPAAVLSFPVLPVCRIIVPAMVKESTIALRTAFEE